LEGPETASEVVTSGPAVTPPLGSFTVRISALLAAGIVLEPGESPTGYVQDAVEERNRRRASKQQLAPTLEQVQQRRAVELMERLERRLGSGTGPRYPDDVPKADVDSLIG
jgi:hypothetical protein